MRRRRAATFEQSALLFGLVVWCAVMRRPERWASGRYRADGRTTGSRTDLRLGS